MNHILTIANHLLPLFITIFVLLTIVFVKVGYPYLKHISLVAAADNPTGVEKLARYLAHKTGGKRIHVSQTWDSFILPAEDLHKLHVERVNNLKDLGQ